MVEQKRRYQRLRAVIPFFMEDGSYGITRDISPFGVFFETGRKLGVDERIEFDLAFSNPSGDLFARCIAKVVRVQPENGRFGVAAAILESRLERRQEPS